MKKVKLKDIVDIYNGSTPSTSDIDNFNGDIPWITPKDLSDRKTRFINYGERNITDKGLKSIGGKLLPAGTILFTSRAPIGLMSINTIEASTNQGFKNMVCKPDKVFNIYLYYLLKTKVSKIQELGTGTTFKEVSKSTIENFELNLIEDLPTQQKIASVLSALDDKIELNSRINAELEAMAKTLYDYWFVQFEFPNAEGKPYKSSGGKMVYNETLKREIPEGWEVKKLKDIAHIIMGQSPKGESYNEENKGILLINGAADYEGNYLKPRIFTSSPTRLCNKGDLVFCIRATIGKLTYAEDVYCLGRGVAAVRANEVEFTEYIFYSLNQEIERFKKHASGSIIVGITKDDLTDYFVLIPPIEILVKIHDNLKPIHSKIRLNLKQNQELAALRDWLLPMLMNGQVKVEEGIMYA